jgi:two-component system, NarL family, nitrate/nitrite response regulator NarL
MTAVRVVLADDHPLFREGVSIMLGVNESIEVVAEAADGTEALEAVVEHVPDVILLDVRMPGLDGFAVLRALRERGLDVRVLLLTGDIDPEQAHLAISEGAQGVIVKDCAAAEVCDAVLAVARGETVLGPRVQAALAAAVRSRRDDPEGPLSRREQEVIQYAAQGLSASETGSRMHLGATTVKSHLQSVYGKLGVNDRAAAVAEAMRRGLVS